MLACLLTVAASAHAATSPAPDPAPTGGVQPDPAPTTTGGTVAPAPRTPTTRTQAPSRTPSTVHPTQPVAQPVPSAASAATAPRVVTTAPRSTARARPKPEHRPKAKRRAHAHATDKPRHAADYAAVVLAHRLIAAPAVLGPHVFGAPTAATDSSLSDGDLVAAASLLLLFVAAVASVLRLSARLADDVPAGRFG